MTDFSVPTDWRFLDADEQWLADNPEPEPAVCWCYDVLSMEFAPEPCDVCKETP